MTRQDSWAERYLALVPEKLTAREAAVLRDLIREDPERFLASLETFIEEGVDDGEEVAGDA